MKSRRSLGNSKTTARHHPACARPSVLAFPLLSSLFPVVTASAVELFVTPQGRDSNPGTRAAPLQSFTAALKPGDEIKIGIIRTQKPLTLTAKIN